MRLCSGLEKEPSIIMNRCIISKESDPYYNLALEEELLRNVDDDEIIFYLWQNYRTVVIGRNQNPFLECDIDRMNAEGVRLARRISGGGAVYHDLGNLNFTFISKEKSSDIKRQIEVIRAAVESFGINAQFSGRNDLLCDGRKFSGHAFYSEDENCFHHGTLMIDVDKSMLGKLLRPSRLKLEAKGITSVKSRVVNLSEICSNITAENMIEALKDSFESEYGELQEYIEYSRENFIPAMTGRYSDHDWIYGESPIYDAEIEVAADYGNFRMLAQVEDGIIKKAKIYTDSLLNFNHDEIEAEMSGTYFHEAADILKRTIEKLHGFSMDI